MWSSTSLICRSRWATHPRSPGMPCVLNTLHVSWHWWASSMCTWKTKWGDIREANAPCSVRFCPRKIKTLRYWNPTAERTAAENPIVMASHGWWTADKATPTATPPAWMQECMWIWAKLVNYRLVRSLTLGPLHPGCLTRLAFPFGFRSTATATAATALAARAR